MLVIQNSIAHTSCILGITTVVVSLIECLISDIPFLFEFTQLAFIFVDQALLSSATPKTLHDGYSLHASEEKTGGSFFPSTRTGATIGFRRRAAQETSS